MFLARVYSFSSRMLLASLFVFAVSAPALIYPAAASPYDYIVVGGGTTGLVVANRLSENQSISVLVIEAGDSVFSNPDVTDTDGYGRALGTAIDWQYKTTLQNYANNKVQTLRAGKAIGGTSTINGKIMGEVHSRLLSLYAGMAYTRAEDAQIDAWEQLGNAGWNWKTLFPYHLKSESYQIPGVQQMSGGASYVPSFHGFNGPLKVGYTRKTATDSLPSTLNSTFQNLGVPYSKDVNGGKMRGFNVYPRTVDFAADVRADAARAYYWPFTSRTNFQMMTKTTATKILWATSTGTNATASGVQVTKADGTVMTISARKEVILAAGALKTPLLLEVSGIGNPK